MQSSVNNDSRCEEEYKRTWSNSSCIPFKEGMSIIKIEYIYKSISLLITKKKTQPISHSCIKINFHDYKQIIVNYIHLNLGFMTKINAMFY